MGKIKNIDELFDMIFAYMDSKEISAELSKAARRKAMKEEQEKKDLEKQKKICDARVAAAESYINYIKAIAPKCYEKKDYSSLKLQLITELKYLETYLKEYENAGGR